MTQLIIKAPLAGWALPLDQVPDPVFAQRLAGDGVAIDPTGSVLHAPCDGEVVPMQKASHAVTLRTEGGVEVLMHVGIDTVQLDGAGFEMLVQPGQRVKAGEPLLSFDLDFVARRVPSMVTPVLLATEGRIVRRNEGQRVAVGDFLFEIEIAAQRAVASSGAELTRAFSVPFDHGLHARPAALIVSALRPIGSDLAEVTIAAKGKTANARSTTSMMSLGVQRGDVIEVKARGPEASRAIEALAALLGTATVPDISAAPAQAVAQPAIVTAPAAGPRKLSAVVASRGVAIGQAARLFQEEIQVEESAAESAAELRALSDAVAATKSRLDSMLAAASGERQTILSAHVELIQDPELYSAAEQQIRRGKSAGYAWRHATRSTAAALEALGDAHMAERVADLRDLENQVLRALIGSPGENGQPLPERAILLADELLPSQLMALDRDRIAGICMARGGPTSHVVIIAASLGIPTLVAGGHQVAEIAQGTTLVLDAERGALHVDPTDAERTRIERELEDRRAQRAADLAAAKQSCETKDRQGIHVYANLGAFQEVAGAVANGAEGCGLLRTEFLFLDRRDAPTEEEQLDEYQQIAKGLEGRPLTIRTMDIGGDKPIPYLPLPKEENPALGLRGLRTSLWQPELMYAQLRAILRVQPAGQARVLLPMVTDIDDIRVVRKMLEECRTSLGVTAMPTLGVMIETPASALLADQLLREADFISIGTNDLSQYVLAMDRGHPELAAKLDALHPAVLRLIATAARAAAAANKEAAVCGGLASDVAAVPILIGLGIHELSVVPSLIPRIKAVIRTYDAGACKELARQALEQSTAQGVRALVERWQAHGPLRLISGE
jgi:phosphoenolpyruvate-protein phosphotransferase